MHEKFHYKSLEEIRQRAAELGEWLPLEEDVSILTSPMRLGDWTLPNRIALQPMEGTDGTEDGAPGPLTIRRYHRFAKGGAALIWFEAVATAPEVRASAHQLYLTPDNLDDFKRLVGEIKEIGLRPGEKLYEELLMKSEHLLTTENKKIFVEEQQVISGYEIRCGLKSLDNFVSAQRPKEELVALMRYLVPTYRDPEEVNREAIQRLGEPSREQVG